MGIKTTSVCKVYSIISRVSTYVACCVGSYGKKMYEKVEQT